MGTFELFNIADDPYEERDLASEHPDEVDRLKAALDEWREETQG